MSNYKLNGTAISTLLQPTFTGSITTPLTNLQNITTDLSNIFSPYDGLASNKTSALSIQSGGNDITNIFNKINPALNISISGKYTYSGSAINIAFAVVAPQSTLVSSYGPLSTLTATNIGTYTSVSTFTTKTGPPGSGYILTITSGSANIIGSNTFSTAGTFTWVCPSGVTTISILCIGGGGGGGVVNTSSVGDGNNGVSSSFKDVSTLICRGNGGGLGTRLGTGGVGGSFVGTGGQTGGTGNSVPSGGGGGGAGGYTAAGGNGGDYIGSGGSGAGDGSGGSGAGGYGGLGLGGQTFSGGGTGLGDSGTSGIAGSGGGGGGSGGTSGSSTVGGICGGGGGGGIWTDPPTPPGIIGAGGGGGGGGLGYYNNYTVIPGNSYTIVVGTGGAGGVNGSIASSPGQTGGIGGVRITWGAGAIYP